jgi:hypothetical protein
MSSQIAPPRHKNHNGAPWAVPPPETVPARGVPFGGEELVELAVG